jgi:lon-related putative ATP-dependent protease
MNKKSNKRSAKFRVPPSRLRLRVNPKKLPKSKEFSRHRTHIIGQDRAISALELGLQLESPGYNVYVSGPSGSGRKTTVKHILNSYKSPRRDLKDYVYVHNFTEPDRPRLLVLNPGQGVRLKKVMEKLVKTLTVELPRATATEQCQKERDRVISEYQRKKHSIASAFQNKVRRYKFAVVEMQNGPIVEHDVLPMMNDEPQPMAALEDQVEAGTLTREQFTKLEKKQLQLRSEFEQVQRRTRSLARDLASLLEEIDRKTGSAVISSLIEDVRDQFSSESITDYLDEVQEALLERIPALVQHDDDGDSEAGAYPHQSLEPQSDPLAPFNVNVVFNNARRKGCPVVFEPTPTVVRLFGTIERSTDEAGRAEADFMNIRAGSLLRANGGFLIVNAEDLLSEPGAWKGLKQSLSTGLMEIRTPEGPITIMTSGLKPDPVPLDVKIIMLGVEDLYRTLYMAEDDFKKIFKVKAEFDVEMDYTQANLEKILAFIQRVTHEEGLLYPNRQAIAALVEEAVRDAEDQYKVTTRFRVIADHLRESSYWAKIANHRTVLPEDVNKAIAERHRRFNLAEEKYRENIERDVVMVSTSGQQVAQINGLAVFDLGDYSFGKPCRITASVGIGEKGIVNIEREAGLSGAIHDKGIYIISGYLRNLFGQKTPLALDASVCFEQSYVEIDGDSASSSEIYAILSALSDLPINQGIAVTGSVNQQGDIQPIGGINYKIEGHFDICYTRGLTGHQGVIIPRGNLSHLMLKPEVVEAARQGFFHVWAVSTIDEGMEILTGVTAGKPNDKGIYPKGSVNRLVSDRLESMAEAIREFQ